MSEETLIPLINSVPPILALLIVMYQITTALKPIAAAYAKKVEVQTAEDKRRQEQDDKIAVELARYKETEALRQKELAAINLQTIALQAEIAKTLPALTATSQQTQTTVEKIGPQVKAVGSDLLTLIEQSHENLGNVLTQIRAEQGVQGETLGRIEGKQDAAIAS